MKSNFSLHAYQRVYDRLSMLPEEVAELLDENKYINIGKETSNNRVHKLFYSKINKMCFVAIQDEKTKTVVTILPIDYHNNICWIVSIYSQNLAKKLIIGEEQNQTTPSIQELKDNQQHSLSKSNNIQKNKTKIVDNTPIESPPVNKPSRFFVSVTLSHVINNSYVRTVSIGKWQAENYDHDAQKLIKCPLFKEEFLSKLKAKKEQIFIQNTYVQPHSQLKNS